MTLGTGALALSVGAAATGFVGMGCLILREPGFFAAFMGGGGVMLAGAGVVGVVAARKLYQEDSPVTAIAVGVLSAMTIAAGLSVTGLHVYETVVFKLKY